MARKKVFFSPIDYRTTQGIFNNFQQRQGSFLTKTEVKPEVSNVFAKTSVSLKRGVSNRGRGNVRAGANVIKLF